MEREAAAQSHRRKLILGLLLTVLLYGLAGFFAAPWAVQRLAEEQARKTFQAALTIERVAINPFALSLEINNLELSDPAGHAVATAEQIFVNFQLSSLFNWAYTLAELRLSAPRLDLVRDTEGAFNIDFLLPGSDEAGQDLNSEPDTLPRFLIHDLDVEDLVVDWRDRAGHNTVHTQLGPASIAIKALNTLPDRSGEQSVQIVSNDLGTLGWSGTIGLNPLHSSGEASIQGATFALLSSYLRQDLGFDIDRGSGSATFNYTIAAAPEGGVSASVNNLSIDVSDLGLQSLDPTDNLEGRVLSLPDLQLVVERIQWPARTIEADSVKVNGGLLNLRRDASGGLNLIPGQASDRADQTSYDSSGGTPWAVSLEQFAVTEFVLNYEDRGVTPHARGGMTNINLNVEGLSNQANTAFPTTLSFEGQAGGRVTLEGKLQALPTLDFSFDIRAERAGLKNLQPYLVPLADVEMASGSLDLQGQIWGNQEQPLYFDGALTIADLELIETDEGTRLGSWQAMDMSRIRLDLAQNDLQISEITFIAPYAEVVIAETGALNLGRISKDRDDGEQIATPPSSGSVPPHPTTPAAAAVETTTGNTRPPPLALTVGRVILDQAAVDFSDFSLPIPFVANITGLQGSMTTVSSASREPTALDFEGAVDEFGMVRITGTVTPMDPGSNTDVAVVFQNIDIPKFTSYSIPFAGREISEGRLDLNLDYRVEAGQLVGENNIVISKIALGQKVPHPEATSLPLDLAIALLKDVEGNIDIDLPVAGDVNDPEFSYGGVVGKAIANLIVKIVASPFMLLGNLVGMEAGELDNLVFNPGRVDLTPPEMEKIAKLAEALELRPELSLSLPPTIASEADTRALQVKALEAQVAIRMNTLGDKEGMYADNRRTVLEALFQEAFPESSELEALRESYTMTAEGHNEDQFDSPAYASELQGWLIDLQRVNDADLAELGRMRATTVRDAILTTGSVTDDRVSIVAALEVSPESDNTLKMPVSLTAQGNEL